MQQGSGRDGGRAFDAETVTTQTDDDGTKTDTDRQQATAPAERILDVLSAHLAASTESTSATDRPDDTVSEDRLETADRQSDHDEQSAAAEYIAEVAAELRSLNKAIEALAEARQSTPLGREKAVTEESGFEWVEPTTSEPSREEQTDQLAAVETRLDAIESTLDGSSLSELEAAVDQQATAHAELEARLDAELDSIETVFEHMVTKIDRLEKRLDAVDDDRQAALEPLRQRAARQDALVDLTQEALRHGVTEAVCHNCDQSVDLGVLETPYCPRCDRRFTGVSAGSRLPFSRAVLRTAEPRAPDVSLDRRSR